MLVAVACAAPAATLPPVTQAPLGSTPIIPTGTPVAATPTAVATATPFPSPNQGTVAPTAIASASAVATGSPAVTAPPRPDACATDQLALKNPGRLTLSTDNPAYPPWWGGDPKTQYPNQPSGGVKWKISNPYSQMGYEGATAYAIATTLGFTPDQVDWLQNTVFEQAFAPGEKKFDFHMAQISITAERAQAVDFSDPYFDSVQSLVALQSDAISSAKSIADLKQYTLGAAANTTSYDLIKNAIQPTAAPKVYPDNDTAVTALQNGQIDGLVVDLGTAFYMRDAQLTGGTIVGQFAPTVQTDHVGAVLDLNSPLTPCVDWAIETMKANGTMQQIYDTWITTGQDIPLLQ
jgi:polar amino acid transport system substrate-binding protein